MIRTAELEQLVEPLRAPVGRYAERLQKLGGEKVLGLTIFGSAAAGNFDPAEDTVRSTIVLDNVDLEFLRLLAVDGVRLGKERIAAPLVMTPGYLAASRDTFSLELLEIQQQHVTVLGEDHFALLVFEQAHIRLQCERELKSILIGLHQGLLASTGSDRLLVTLSSQAIENLVRVLRGLLWLSGERDHRPAVDVVQQAEKIVNRPLPGIHAALNSADTAGWQKYCALYGDVQALGEFANAF